MKLRPKVIRVKYPGIEKGIGEDPDVKEHEDLQKLNKQNHEVGLQTCVGEGRGFQEMGLKRKMVQDRSYMF